MKGVFNPLLKYYNKKYCKIVLKKITMWFLM